MSEHIITVTFKVTDIIADEWDEQSMRAMFDDVAQVITDNYDNSEDELGADMTCEIVEITIDGATSKV